MLTHGIIAPHPPIIIPAIGKSEIKKVEKTISALLTLNHILTKDPPDTFVIISPHGLIDPGHLNIRNPQKKYLEGGFGDFGSPEIRLAFENDTDLTQLILNTPELSIIPSDDDHLDHGALVPLFYLSQQLPNTKLVSLTISFNSPREHFKYGKILRKIFDSTPTKIAFIASGDLSHRLEKDSPAGYSSEGKKFDAKLQKLLANGDTEGILNFDPFWLDEVGECGLRSIATLLGLFDGATHTQKILSYEGPFGVGYLTGIWAQKSQIQNPSAAADQ